MAIHIQGVVDEGTSQQPGDFGDLSHAKFGDMNITLPAFAILAIFLLGIVVGWMFAKVRVSASVRVGSPGPDISQANASGMRLTRRVNTVRRLTLKCKCGATWKFAEGISPLPPNTNPIPTGDSFVCPGCGNAIDLKQERQLEAQATAEALRRPTIRTLG